MPPSARLTSSTRLRRVTPELIQSSHHQVSKSAPKAPQRQHLSVSSDQPLERLLSQSEQGIQPPIHKKIDHTRVQPTSRISSLDSESLFDEESTFSNPTSPPQLPPSPHRQSNVKNQFLPKSSRRQSASKNGELSNELIDAAYGILFPIATLHSHWTHWQKKTLSLTNTTSHSASNSSHPRSKLTPLRISNSSLIYMSAVLQYLAHELLQLSVGIVGIQLQTNYVTSSAQQDVDVQQQVESMFSQLLLQQTETAGSFDDDDDEDEEEYDDEDDDDDDNNEDDDDNEDDGHDDADMQEKEENVNASATADNVATIDTYQDLSLPKRKKITSTSSQQQIQEQDEWFVPLVKRVKKQHQSFGSPISIDPQLNPSIHTESNQSSIEAAHNSTHRNVNGEDSSSDILPQDDDQSENDQPDQSLSNSTGLGITPSVINFVFEHDVEFQQLLNRIK